MPIIAYYDFQDKLTEGLKGEMIMDNFFKMWFDIIRIDPETQKKLHYDRLFKYKNDSASQLKVEYKTDLLAIDTGNLYVEKYSNKKQKTPGWFYKSQADWFCILVGNKLFITDSTLFRFYVNRNKSRYKERDGKPTLSASGEYSYRPMGYLMPLRELEMISSVYFI